MAKSERSGEADDRLLQAAARVIRKEGFEAATVRSIAKEAGLLPGSVHYRYRTKEALLTAVCERALGVVVGEVRRATAAAADPLERLRQGVRAHLRLLLSEDDSVYVLMYEWGSLRGETREAMIRLRDRYDAAWAEVLEDSARQGRLRAGLDLRLVRLFSFGAMNWAAQWYSPRGGKTLEEIGDAFVGLLAYGLLPEAGRPADMAAELGRLSALRPGQTPACG
jgi:TetR/AcrR family transcriptional regulator, cholesterol catabolism regulator